MSPEMPPGSAATPITGSVSPSVVLHFVPRQSLSAFTGATSPLI